MPDKRDIKLEESWKHVIGEEFQKPYMGNLRNFLLERKQQGATVYPTGDNIFNALNSTPFNQVKVVIIGQDPYHGPNQAHGLCFSVRGGIKPPPSLVNIYKELHDDVGINIPNHGNLQKWADQGVLLLNSVLTVERGTPASHQGKGWEAFTDAVIHKINEEKEHVVFMLWGSYAQKKASFVDRSKHLVLTAPHPSPFSVHRGFFGCRHFSKANEYLKAHGQQPIDWQV